MEAGAIGVSTGLYYEPARAAPTEEVIEICRPLTERNGIYCTHMRDEGERMVDSLEETFRIGRELGVPVVISHHKVRRHSRTTAAPPRRCRSSRRRCARSRSASTAIPYSASSTILSCEPRGDRLEGARHVVQAASRVRGLDLDDIAREMGLSAEEAVERLLPAGAIYFSHGRGRRAAHPRASSTP